MDDISISDCQRPPEESSTSAGYGSVGTCSRCGGSGEVGLIFKRRCPRCGGNGRKSYSAKSSKGGTVYEEDD